MIGKLAGLALAAAAIASAPIAAAAPNSNGSDNANPNAGGIGVASATGDGPSAVLNAVQALAPSQAQNGLSTALSHLPTSIVTAQTNGNSNANQNGQTHGLAVAGVAGTGPFAVLTAIQGFAPPQSQGGLGTALSQVPTP